MGVRKVLELMKKLAKEGDGDEEDGDEEKDEEKADGEKKEEKKDKKDEESTWLKFWKEFNKNLKMGCYEDDSNRSKLSKLLLFITTKSDGKEISLDKYLDRMQESQESIYYMSGESLEVMSKAPSLQVFNKKDIEVLMLADHLDEPCIQKLADYEGKKFVSIQKADVKLRNRGREEALHEAQGHVQAAYRLVEGKAYGLHREGCNERCRSQDREGGTLQEAHRVACRRSD